ncbi:MAG TPA: cell division protein FtsZ [Anaerolineaceae bacterium]|nr:cell division protein FtsZ [Anaerolineaceae bacterium]
MASNPIRHTPITVHQPVLKVLGLGGGGCNAVNRMIELGLNNVQFIAANTDRQALESSLAPVKIQLGPKVTRGLGAGGTPEIGEAAAEESYRELGAALAGADMVFLTAGMGGGTGTGSIPIAARVARSIGAVTISIVTTPFSFEMGRRQRNAREGLAKLRMHSDTLITVPNDRLLYVAPKDLPMDLAFRLADDVLRQGIQGISELITEAGLINVDFAHVRRLMQLGGGSMMAIGQGQGDGKARQALEQAMHHPLLESVSLESAAGMIVNFTGGSDLTFFEVAEALTHLQEQSGNRAEIIPGVINDERMQDRAQVILIVTGIGATPIEEALPGVERVLPVQEPVKAVAQPNLHQPQPIPTTRPTLSQIQNGERTANGQSQVPQRPAPQGFSATATPQANSFAWNDAAARPIAGEQWSQTQAVPQAQPASSAPKTQVELSGSTVNLDLPAFMRRRARYAG